MENLEKLIYDLYKKNARQCTNEEIYNALLIYTKNQLFEKPSLTSKKLNRNHLLETVVLDVWQHASWIPSQLSVFRAKVLV